jgi:hypothetical protein
VKRAARRAPLRLLLLGSLALGGLSVGVAGALDLPRATETRVEPAPQVPFARDLTLSGPDTALSSVVAQALPAGVSYLPGSSSLNGSPIPDPRSGPDGTLYFELSGPPAGLLHFVLNGPAPTGPVSTDSASPLLPQAGLLVRYGGTLSETLQGHIDQTGLKAARVVAAPVPERDGVIRAPQDGLSLRSRATVNVTLDVPEGFDPSGALSVNGVPVPDSRIGTRTTYSDGHLRLLYIAVPLKIGENLLSSFGDSVRVVAAGPAQSVVVTPRGTFQADGSTPLVFGVDVRDALGRPADVPSVSVSVVGSEPLDADADPNQSGHQVRTQNGQSTLTLRPLSLPGNVTLDFDVNGHSQQVIFAVQGDQKRLILAQGSVQLSGLGVSGNSLGAPRTGQLSAQAAASAELPVAGGKLYLAVNGGVSGGQFSGGVNQEPLPYSRFPGYGDSSVQRQPLKAQGPLAARLELPGLHAEYGQDAAVDPVFGVHSGADGLNVSARGETRFGASLTLVPGDLRTVKLTPDGTRVLRLPTASVPGSETVLLTESEGGSELSRRPLKPGLDYVLGGEGLLEFPAPLLPVTPQGRDVRLQVSYRSVTDSGLNAGLLAGSLTAGASVSRDVLLGTGAASFRGTLSAGGLLVAGVPAFGVHAQLGGVRGSFEGLLATSGGALLANMSGSYKAGPVGATLTARAEGRGYTGPGAGSPGTTFNASGSYALSPTFGLKLNGSASSTPGQGAAGAVSSGTVSSGLLAAGVGYAQAPFRAELLLRKSFGSGPAGAGLGVQALIGYSASGSDLSLGHAQDFGAFTGAAGQARTTLSASTVLAPELKLGLNLARDWRLGTLEAGLSLGGTRAGVNYTVGYDLPSSGGSLGRARLAATTSRTLAPGLTGDLAASASSDAGLTASLGASLKYQDAGTVGSVGADAAFSPLGSKYDLKAAMNLAYGPTWSLSSDALTEFGSAVQLGQRYGLGLAWRGDQASALGYLRFRSGSFGEQRLSAELELEQRPGPATPQQAAGQKAVNTLQAGQPERQARPLQEMAASRAAANTPKQPEPRPEYQTDPSRLFSLSRSRLELRESAALAVPLQGGAVTVQGLAGARFWLSGRLALEGMLGAAYQPGGTVQLGSTVQPGNTVQLLAGAGVSVVPVPGWGVAAGYNFLGFNSDLGSQPTRKGVYLRLDLLLDELKR